MFGSLWPSFCLQQTGRRGRKAQADRAKGGATARVPAHGRVNGHHQENGMEIMSLFEVVKLGKSATQVGKHCGWIISSWTRFDDCNDKDGNHLFFFFFSLLLMTGLRHIKMIVTSPFWSWLIFLFNALAVKVSNGFFFRGKEFKCGSTNIDTWFLLSCHCVISNTGAVSAEMFRQMQNSEIIRKMTEEFDEVMGLYIILLEVLTQRSFFNGWNHRWLMK